MIPKYIPLIIKDLISFRLGLHKIEKGPQVDNMDKSFLKVPFHNKGIEMVKLSQIVNSKSVQMSIPNFIKNSVPPIISFSYTKTIAGKIFNFKQCVKNITNFEVGMTEISCDCHESQFRYEPVGHVITGNLGIIENRKLRKLVSKGPSYREQNNINWNTNLKILRKSIREYKLQWAKKEKVDSRALDEWECKVIGIVKARIDRLKQKKYCRNTRVLSERSCKEYLNNFHKRFVLVPADKAGNNVLIVCKKYYIEVILKELDTCNGTSPQTYTPCTAHVGDLLAAHVDFMNGQNVSVPTDLRNLRSFYWLPKMHKNPIGSRFIAASSACTTKPLSKLLTYSLKLVAEHFKQYCEGITRNTGINCFWIIDNAVDVLTKFKKFNRTKAAKHFDS